MICPLCQETLQMTDRQGVEIDYCPKCRGVWLDRGELQKLIDLSIAQLPQTASPAARQPVAQPIAPLASDAIYSQPRQPQPTGDRYRSDYDDDRYSERHHDSDYYRKKHKKRESWFSELFDFD